MQPWGAGDLGVLRWVTPILGRFNEMLWHAVKTECYISIPQTGALLDFIPGTRYFDLFFLFGLRSTKAALGGAQIPLRGEFEDY